MQTKKYFAPKSKAKSNPNQKQIKGIFNKYELKSNSTKFGKSTFIAKYEALDDVKTLVFS